jgi:hypothetical protein
MVTPKAGAKRELLFNKPATGVLSSIFSSDCTVHKIAANGLSDLKGGKILLKRQCQEIA